MTGRARLRRARRCAVCLSAALLLVPAVVGAATGDYPPPPGSYPVEPLVLPGAAGLAQSGAPAAPAAPTPAASSRMLTLPDDGGAGSNDRPAAERLFGAPTEPTAPPPAPAAARPYRPAATPAPRSEFSLDSRRRPTTPPSANSIYPARPAVPYPAFRGYPAPPAYVPRARPAGRDPAATPRPPSAPLVGNASAPQPAQSKGAATPAPPAVQPPPAPAAGQARSEAVFRPPDLAPTN